MTMLALTNFPFHGWGWGWAWLGPLMLGMVFFWGAIIFGGVWLFRESFWRREPDPQEAALTVLNRRFAEGDLSPDDYQQRRSVLIRAGEPCTDQDITESERS